MNITSTLSTIGDLIGHWHNMGSAMSMEDLYNIRRELAAHYFYLTTQVKPLFVKRATSYITRKRNVAASIIEEMNTHIKLSKEKAEAMAEAKPKTWTDRQEEINAEAEVDALRLLIDSVKHVLTAMNQELADKRQEDARSHYLDNLKEHEQDQ